MKAEAGAIQLEWNEYFTVKQNMSGSVGLAGIRGVS